jgi:glucan phosphoethanolaminetransferase (alkaline phosphatase superfamily)
VIEIRGLLPHIRIMTLMEGVLKEAGTAYLSRAPGLTPGISWGHVADFFDFCVVFIFVFVMCLVCLMLPVSRLSILCVVLCLFLSSSYVSCA